MDKRIEVLRRERNLRQKRIDEMEKEISELKRIIDMHLDLIVKLDKNIAIENKITLNE